MILKAIIEIFTHFKKLVISLLSFRAWTNTFIFTRDNPRYANINLNIISSAQ
jgi:hypothetical protein